MSGNTKSDFKHWSCDHKSQYYGFKNKKDAILGAIYYRFDNLNTSLSESSGT